METVYYGTKKITAWPCIKDGEQDGAQGYAVKYSDNYTSWSPKDVFEEAYKPNGAMNFGHAIAALKEGLKLARAGWNGKGMWLELQVPDAGSKMTLPYIYMKTACGNLVPWLARQTDVLADDWGIVE